MSNRTPSYCLHKATGQAVVRIDGRDYYLGKYGTPESRNEYNRLIAEWFANGQCLTPGKNGAGPGLSVNELIWAFWKHAEEHYRHADGTPTSEIPEYRRTLHFLKELYGDTPAREYGPLRLKAIRQKMIDAGLCRGVINQRIGRIKRLFKWGVENELVPGEVYHGLQAVRGLARGRSAARDTEPVGPVSLAVVQDTLPHLNRHLRAIVEVQLLTGARPGEICLMRACDIDMSGPVWLFRPEAHKTAHHGHKRIIAIGPRAQAIIKDFLALETQAYLFSPLRAMEERRAEMRQNRKTKVQPSQQGRRKRKPKRQPGERYNPLAFAQAVRKAILKANTARACPPCKELEPEARCPGCKAAAIPHWHPHQLRHTRATELRREFGLDTARTVLGHRSPQITETYAELDAGKAAEVMARLG